MYAYSRKYSAPNFVFIQPTGMATERDKGYAWVVLVASTLIMFLGPSTLTAYGNMTGTVVMGDFERIWTVVAMACFMYSTAILIAPLSELTSYRKIALLGCLVAASGFLLTGSAMESPKWFLLTLSTCVGIGLGLAVHATFLVVTCYFHRYRGLAIGIMSVSVGAGSLLSPVMYDFMSNLKDRLHLRALVVTIGFMAASFYANPPRLPRSRGLSPAAEGNERNQEGGNGGKSGREAIPLVIAKDEHREGPPLHALQHRRPSKFMEAIAATLPAIIPEESESEDPSKCPSSVEDDDAPNQTTVNSVKSVENGVIHSSTHHLHVSNNNRGDTSEMRRSESNRKLSQDSCKDIRQFNKGGTQVPEKIENNNAVAVVANKIKSLPPGFQLLADPTFLNMALAASLVMVVVPNFPVVLYACVARIRQYAKSGDKYSGDGDDQGDIIMYIMFSLDLVSRLLISYLSDFAFVNRRLAFLCGATVGAVIISAISFVEDIRLIYFLSALYGLSSGVLPVTELLMFADIFGMEQFPAMYGLVGLIKALLILIISAAFLSPCSSFVYVMEPMLHPKVNHTICNNCDPLGIFPVEYDARAQQQHHSSLLQIISIPGFLCAFAWCAEFLIKYIISRRSLQSATSSPSSETKRTEATPV